MQEILCGCGASTTIVVGQQTYRYNPGVSSNVPTPPAQNPNTLGIVPDNPLLPATCYPDTADGSGPTYNWNIELAQWL